MTAEKEINATELLAQTKQFREWLKLNFGEGAMAIVDPHDITIVQNRIFIGEPNPDYEQSPCLISGS